MRLPAVALLVALAGCEQPRTELVVRVDSEVAWGPGRAVQSVVVTVRRDGPDGPVRDSRTTAVDGVRAALPLSVGLVPADDSDAPVWVEVLGCRAVDGCVAADAVAAQRALVRFTRGETQVLPMVLAAACPGARCASDERCLTTSGQCDPASRAQATLRPYRSADLDASAEAAVDAGGLVDVARADLAPAPDLGSDAASPGEVGTDAASGDDAVDATTEDVTTAVDVGAADVATDVPVLFDAPPTFDVVDATSAADVPPIIDAPSTTDAGMGFDLGSVVDASVGNDVTPVADDGTFDAGASDVGPRDAGLPPCAGPLCPCAPATPMGWCAIGATCTAGACVAGALVGALVITEIMNDPDAVGDGAGEWFEVYNRSTTPVDLRGLRVRGSGSEMFEVTGGSPIVVAGNGYAVLGASADTLVNGGVTVAFAYAAAMALGNSNTDIITLLASDNTTLIDTVTYGTTVASGWAITSGRSKSLRPAFLDDVSNNTAANWCAGGPSFGRGDFGTPGAANVCQ